MKTKVVFGLSLGCLLFALGGMVIPAIVLAQAPNPVISGWPFSVNFIEDPYRMHGLQVKSYHVMTTGVWTPLETVPIDKRFIVTDICVDANTNVMLRDGVSGQRKIEIRFSDYSGYWMPLKLGIVFMPGETIEVLTQEEVTISGYFVDL